MEYDPLFLSRIQFAFIVSFHILFPAFTIGLANWLVVLEGLYLATGGRPIQAFRVLDQDLRDLASAWAWCPASSWPTSSAPTGAAARDMRRQRARAAARLRSADRVLPGGGFLGVMLFGCNRVPRGAAFLRHLHGGARHADLVLLDPRRQQLDADAGRATRSATGASSRTDWWAVDLQPVVPLPPRAHGASRRSSRPCFVVGGVGAWYLLRGDARRGTATMHARWRSG